MRTTGLRARRPSRIDGLGGPSYLEADKISETGGYAHLITAAAQYLFCLEGKSDWQEERIPSVE